VTRAPSLVHKKQQMKVKDYKDLKVWQKGIEIVDKIYSITAKFPKEEVYGLISNRRKYTTEKELEGLTEDINHETRMLVSLINKI